MDDFGYKPLPGEGTSQAQGDLEAGAAGKPNSVGGIVTYGYGGARTTDQFDCARTEKEGGSRVVDVDASLFQGGIGPITGISTAEQLPFAEAVERCGIGGLTLNVISAQRHGATLKNHGQGGALTADHIAAIHLYTQASVFYRMLNATLRDRDRTFIRPYLPYLRLLLEALRQLPAKTRTVYRGVKLDLSDKFRPGDQPVWWSMSSASSVKDVVLSSKEFCGDSGPRIVFVIKAVHARDIAAFSAFPGEQELILLPGAQLKVTASVSRGGGLHEVEMEETDPPLSLIELEGFIDESKMDQNYFAASGDRAGRAAQKGGGSGGGGGVGVGGGGGIAGRKPAHSDDRTKLLGPFR